MIVTVTLNPSLDKTGVIPSFRYDDVLRVEDMSCTPGGKGVNVSRVLGLFGVKNRALSFIGGLSGKEFVRMTAKEKIRLDSVVIGGNTRTNWTLLDEKASKVIKINEPGPVITDREAHRFLKKLKRYAVKDNVIVISGGPAPGLSKAFFAVVNEILRGKVKAIFVDSELPGIRLKADHIKPNVYEAERMLGVSLKKPKDFIRALSSLKKFAAHPFISAAEKGLFLEDEDGDFLQMVPPRLEHYSIPGAGDAFTAGFCAALVNGNTLTECALQGTACAAATVKHARFASPEETEEMMGLIEVKVIG